MVPACLIASYLSRDSVGNVTVDDSSQVFSVTLPRKNGAIIHCAAHVLMVWHFDELSATISKLFIADQVKLEKQEEKEDNSLSSFLILTLDDFSDHEMTTLRDDGRIAELSYGDDIMLCSTPFGNGHINEFMNSVTTGIVANIVDREVVYLCDVRCTPGCQGGLLYKLSADGMIPAAVVIHPILWRHNEASGLALAVNLKLLLTHLVPHARSNFSANQKSVLKQLALSNRDCRISLPIAGHMERLVRVDIKNSWGSGILISHRHVLTCAHVVAGISIADIKVKSISGIYLCHSIPYISSHMDSLDVAIIQLDSAVESMLPLTKAGVTTPGTSIRACGYGILKEAERPMLTRGTICKVMKSSFIVYCLMTSCFVHSGSSGGMMVDEYGDIVGLVTANTYDCTNDVVHTNVSMAIPMSTLLPCISALVHNGSVSAFVDLEDYLAKSVISPLKSKL